MAWTRLAPVLTASDADEQARRRAAEMDAADPLAGFRDRFLPLPDGIVYLDGNSLGRPLRSTLEVVAAAIREEWGQGLIGSWSEWTDLPRRVGDELGNALLGSAPGEVVVADSTSVNIYKLVMAAAAARPGRDVLVTEADNFPSDRYVLQGVAQRLGLTLRLVPADIDNGVDLADLAAALDERVAAVCLSHVGYRSGALVDMRAATQLVHDHGALVLWDLCHSVGSVPIDLTGARADLAVGCTYKYLNAGPGAPAFLYVRRDLQEQLSQPIWGWFGQADQFEMDDTYAPMPGIGRFQVGTPPILGVLAVREGVRLLAEAGMEPVRAKGQALTALAAELADRHLAPRGFRIASPRDADQRGSHLTLAHPEARQLVRRLADGGVITDFRTPDRLRLGASALSTSFTDIVEAVLRLRGLAL